MPKWVAVLAAAAGFVLLAPTHTARDTRTAAVSAPALRDLSGRLTVGCGFDAAVSAPEVCAGGRVIAVYIDDTQPDIEKWVSLAAAKYPLVIRAVAMGAREGADCHWLHVLCAVEFYPYESGYPLSAWGRMPRASGYILQARFSFTGQPVRRWQTARLIQQARRFHPVLIFLY